MVSEISKNAYKRAYEEDYSIGVLTGDRSQPTLEEARAELAKQMSLSIEVLLKDRYGPLIGLIGENAITNFLKSFESGLSWAKGDITLVLQELIDRNLPSIKGVHQKRGR